MNSSPFTGKVALVTGSSRGIGSAIAHKFASRGADLVINYRRETGGVGPSKGQQVKDRVEAMGRRALLIQGDISIKSSVRSMMDQINDHFGRLDFLILNAARAPFKAFEKLLERELRLLVETNFLGQIFCIQEAVPLLAGSQGKVVFISSLGSRFHNPSYPLGSMKAAMEAVVRDCSVSLRDRNISVNAVCAGLVRSESLKVLKQHWHHLDRIPKHLFLEPEEIAEVVLFLCSSASSGIHGQTIVVDKGLGNSLYCFTDHSS
jgi:NAD(P)-dependent dehydrogenase (short-subunit alcohol dehydrogenase family)